MDNNKTEIISNLFEDKEIISVWDSEKEDSEVTTNCSHLKMLAQDWKMIETDTLGTKGILRLIKSVIIPKSNSLNYKYIDEQKQIENKNKKESE